MYLALTNAKDDLIKAIAGLQVKAKDTSLVKTGDVLTNYSLLACGGLLVAIVTKKNNAVDKGL